MKILLTGIKGFIGHHVYHRLKDAHEIIGYDNLSGLATGERNVPFHLCDILDCEFPEVDLVIHLAAIPNVRESHKNPAHYWQNNAVATKRLFNFYENKCKVIYASSSSVKSNNSPYSMTKAACELMAPDNSIGMRFFTVYGPNGRPDMLIRILKEHRTDYLTDHSRDFVHVYDVVNAIKHFVDSDVTGIFEIGSGNTVPVAYVAELMGLKLPVKSVTGEDKETRSDLTAMLDLGWTPTIGIKEGITLI